ncbi:MULTISPECIES: hypothetical protein [Deefgea]|uniref:Uncharacterized protein n=1 Tax=Deefgea chitinilytica TaxID=570276 RepID=A0ABS2C7F3_9NEIS|nr:MULTISPECIES: hypothetical protein [Deefgea]MBM5569962.1 hypothetical protein [Deefgea chitinilytica]MBM9887191.1 hypothetical protein [Deefgea sp. CFH1-16]
MNPIEQVEAEKLAQNVVTRTEALAVFANRSKVSKWDWLVALSGCGIGLLQSGGIEWIGSGEIWKSSHLNHALVYIMAWGGFFLAVAAYIRSRENTKRLEAAILLLNQK